MKWQLDACCRSRIGFSDALLSDNLGRAKRPRQAQLGRVRRAAPRAASRAVTHPVSRVIECACARDASAIPALLVAVLRVRLSWSATEAVSRCWQRAAKSAAPETPNVRFATQDLQPSTGRKQPARVKDGSLNVSHRRWRFMVSGYVKLSGLMAAGLGEGLCTVEGRQLGDLRQSCRSVLIRRAKTAARLSERLSLFWRGPPTR